MSTLPVERLATPPPDQPPVPPPLLALEPGDHLTAEEFERLYDAMPDLKKAELINGVVHMPSPVRFRRHGKPNRHLSGWFAVYEAATPGVEGADNTTTRLQLANRPQPDMVLLIDPARGGQARISPDDYVEGGPELVAEIAASSVAIDLHERFDVYRQNHVREYIVWRVLERQVDWFVLREGRYERLLADADGLLRSEVFPGLWLDGAALVRGDLAAVLATLQRGLATAEHGAFVGRLNPPAPPPSA
jgi:Uma2 family endonuclease